MTSFILILCLDAGRTSPNAVMSPRHEALNILEDLYSTLDDDQKHDQKTQATVVRIDHGLSLTSLVPSSSIIYH